MSHYQKLATIIFRFAGAMLMFISALVVIVYFISRIGFIDYWDWRILIAATVWTIPPLVTGFFIFAASKPLARWVCFDFDKDE